eukprot:scaffold2522_cov203-Chaetoceros_neogracile.AAC.4
MSEAMSYAIIEEGVRDGKTLSWREVNMTVSPVKKWKKILTDMYGEMPVNDIVAIMGPSGCGKTSLLNILSGRMQSRGPAITSDIRLNNYECNPTKLEIRRQIAFLA